MAPAMKEKKASRITTACNPCRSRKQKCSGERPTCEQCLEYNRMCAWPEQLKRGPAKGYIEALEHRLQETENLLLSVLPYLSPQQLASVVADRNSTSTGVENERPAHTPVSPLRKRGVEYWKSFPLSNPENIRRWQQDCLHHRSSIASSVSYDPHMDSADSRRSNDSLMGSPDAFEEASPTDTRSHSQFLSSAPSRDRPPSHLFVNPVEDEQQRGPANGASSIAAAHRHHVNGPDPHHHHQQHQQQQHRILSPGGTESHTNVFYPVDQNALNQLSFINKGYTGHPAPPELSSWDAAPPPKFQQQFLW